MSADVRQALVEHGIELRRYQPGNHRAPCPWCAKGKRDTALAVKIDGDGATWFCHRCGEKDAVGNGEHSRGSALKRDCRDAATKPAPRSIDLPAEQRATLSETGRALWFSCRPITPDDMAGRYLIGRGCALPPVDGDLRWHPAVKYYVDGKPVHVGPAMIGLVTDITTGEPKSLHQTWLKPDGSGKADLDPPRKLLGGHSAHGGIIRLWPDDEVTMGLVIGEGIETCLAAARAGLTPVWSTISAGNLKTFPVLPGLDGLTVLVDHDKPNPHTGRRAGHDAALAVVERYVAAGFDPERDLRIVLPPTEGEDAADLEMPA